MFVFTARAVPVQAQHAELDALEITQSGQAYLKATRLRRIESAVAYFDPTQPPPPLETQRRVPTERETTRPGARTVEGGYWVTLAIAATLFVMMAYLVFQGSGGLSVSFSRDPSENGTRTGKRRGSLKSVASLPAGLDAILAMRDREQALISLCAALLARVVGAEGVLLNKAWTARETLRRVPAKHPHRSELQNLVFASEKVQFGGRLVTEEEFRAHVDRLRPLLTKVTP